MTEPGHASREILPLVEDWSYVPDKATSRWLAGDGDNAGTNVRLPHTWNDRDTFQTEVAYRQGDGSYRCRFCAPPEEIDRNAATWRLRSEGFYGTGEVWLDGRRMSAFDAQYIGLDIDLTPFLQPASESMLGIRLTNRCASHVLPGIDMPDFILHGGLAGRVWLERIPGLALEWDETWVTTNLVSGARAELSMATSVQNRSAKPRVAAIFCGMEMCGIMMWALMLFSFAARARACAWLP